MISRYILCTMLIGSLVHSDAEGTYRRPGVSVEVNTNDAGTLLAAVAGVCAGAYALKMLFTTVSDRWDRSYLSDLEQHLTEYQRTTDGAVTTWPRMFEQDQQRALYALSQLAQANAGYQVNNLVRALPTLQTYTLNTYDHERYELAKLMNKLRGYPDYAAQFDRAQALDYHFASLQERAMSLHREVGAYNDFVRRYRALKQMLEEHAVQIYAWRHGSLSVSDCCRRDRYPFTSYRDELYSSYRELSGYITALPAGACAQLHDLMNYIRTCAYDIELFMRDIEVSYAYTKERADREVERLVNEAERRIEQHIQQIRPVVDTHVHVHDTTVHHHHDTVVVSVQTEQEAGSRRAACVAPEPTQKKEEEGAAMTTEELFDVMSPLDPFA
jgi:hypothetical protein